eukprot:ANDGO_05791.mRNA.1 Putative SWI/SNF-related matrix-associated actin-dependent regulator of chromatin subfamily A member 3-like 2
MRNTPVIPQGVLVLDDSSSEGEGEGEGNDSCGDELISAGASSLNPGSGHKLRLSDVQSAIRQAAAASSSPSSLSEVPSGLQAAGQSGTGENCYLVGVLKTKIVGIGTLLDRSLRQDMLGGTDVGVSRLGNHTSIGVFTIPKKARSRALRIGSIKDDVARRMIPLMEGNVITNMTGTIPAQARVSYMYDLCIPVEIRMYTDTLQNVYYIRNELQHYDDGVGLARTISTVAETQRDLTALFNAAFLSTDATGQQLPRMPTPPGVRTHLFPHQEQALAWMLQHESPIQITEAHPVYMFWERVVRRVQVGSYGPSSYITLPRATSAGPSMSAPENAANRQGVTDMEPVALDVKPAITASPISPTATAAAFPPRNFEDRVYFKDTRTGLVQDTHPDLYGGGILADDMGLGKSLSTLSLLVATRGLGKTLLVCPLSLMSSWVDQIEEHLQPGALKYGIYHGPNRDPLDIKRWDLIITTYQTVSSEFTDPVDVQNELDRQRRQRLQAQYGDPGMDNFVVTDSDAEDDDDDDDDDDVRHQERGGQGGTVDGTGIRNRVSSSDGVANPACECSGETARGALPTNSSSSSNAQTRQGGTVNGEQATGLIPRGKRARRAVFTPREGLFRKDRVRLYTDKLFYRVIFDEAHMMKTAGTKTSRACWFLNAKVRWCLTGTPVQNHMKDLFSLFRTIRADPFDSIEVWNDFISKPLKSINHDDNVLGWERLQRLIKSTCLRRSKECDENHNQLVRLPVLQEMVRKVTLSERDRELYNFMFKQSRDDIQRLIRRNELLAQFMHVLSLLMRLRQLCNHSSLLTNLQAALQAMEEVEMTIRDDNQDRSIQEFIPNAQDLERLKESILQIHHSMALAAPAASSSSTLSTNTGANASSGGGVADDNDVNDEHSCPICFVAITPEDGCVTRCSHVYHTECLQKSMDLQPLCPLCRNPLNASSVRPLKHVVELLHEKEKKDRLKQVGADGPSNSSNKASPAQKEEPGLPNAPQPFVSSSKVDAIIHDILFEMGSEEKVLIFSQWTSFLSILEEALTINGISYTRLDGTMSRTERLEAVRRFQESSSIDCRVFLISLRAGGFGLNLTRATQVMIVDPWWNEPAETQARDRAWRIGNTAERVVVRRYISADTIEEKLQLLQKQKVFLFEGAFGIVGGSREAAEELRKRRMDTIRLLFVSEHSVDDLV